MLNTMRGDGSDCILTLLSIKMEHPRPLQVCTNVCTIFAHTGAGVIRFNLVRLSISQFTNIVVVRIKNTKHYIHIYLGFSNIREHRKMNGDGLWKFLLNYLEFLGLYCTYIYVNFSGF